MRQRLRVTAQLALALAAGMGLAGCIPGASPLPTEVNPFADLASVPQDGEPHVMEASIEPIGDMQAGQVVSIRVDGDGIDQVLVLARDPESDASGLIAGGGLPNTTFSYRVQVAGAYYVAVLFNPSTESSEQRATLTVGPGEASFTPPAAQIVRIVFEANFLTAPGLFDPESSTQEDLQVLEDVTPVVRAQIMDRLRAVFAGTAIQIVDENDPLPATAYSTMMFSPQRVTLDEGIPFDAAVPAIDPNSGCNQPVIFGEVLPRGTQVDPGNSKPDDSAVVYVGSFQGRGADCRSAVITSVSTIVLALAQTGAHEIGHLVGLYHGALVDIMDRQPSLAFQRELGFTRSQILTEIPVANADGTLEPQPRVLTNIIQDPQFYFQANFSH